MKRTERYPDTSTFRNYNANPKNKVTSDCVIRALSTAMERPYNEVYEELFKFSLKCGLMLNDPKCYDKYLQEQGWRKHKQPRKTDNTKYTGVEWCKYLQDGYDYVIGELKPMIAHIGGHHIVAIIDGKVYDTWNSTLGAIGNYWTKG